MTLFCLLHSKKKVKEKALFGFQNKQSTFTWRQNQQRKPGPSCHMLATAFVLSKSVVKIRIEKNFTSSWAKQKKANSQEVERFFLMLSWAIWGWRKKSVDVYFKKRKHFFWRRKKNVSFFLQQSSFEKPQKTLYPQLASSVAFFRKESVYLNEKKKRQKQSYFILACLSSWESFKTLL